MINFYFIFCNVERFLVLIKLQEAKTPATKKLEFA